MTPKRTTWRMDLHQLTVYKWFRWFNLRAITFSFVDQSSSHGLEKFGENIPPSPEVIGVYTLNFRPKFKFLQLSFFRGTPVPDVGGALGSQGQSITRLKISGGSTP